ncbi:MAG: hypothetical protein JNM24_16180 [Bdellovibrionaceae bacterium]|nr:hypothetical protein [Pseudobdellovibrionaceae bacterium]
MNAKVLGVLNIILSCLAIYTKLWSTTESIGIARVYELDREVGRQVLEKIASVSMPVFAICVISFTMAISIHRLKILPKKLSIINVVFGGISLLTLIRAHCQMRPVGPAFVAAV